MTHLVVGATGATGSLLVKQLLDRDLNVRVIVRSPDKLPEEVRNHSNLSVIHASLLDLDDQAMAQHVQDCEAIASCLGHTISFQGIYGQPRRLVTDAARRLCNAIRVNQPDQPVKYVLMNTTGNRNGDLSEPISFLQRVVTGLLRLVLPPHVDNEKAADYLRVEVGQNDQMIEWVAVRPDSLIDEVDVSEYTLHPSPTRDPLFNAGKTSRINVAHFMADLMTDNELWQKWKGQMPVIYNKEQS